MPRRLESVWLGRDAELLDAMLDFYAPEAERVVDVCCNARRMWRGSRWAPRVTYYDRDPACRPHLVADWARLPDGDATVDVLVYDPPHLPNDGMRSDFVGDFGLASGPKGDNASSLYPPFLREAARVLAPDGVVLAKIKDYVHNHRRQWCLEDFNACARAAGLTPCDLVIKRRPAGAMVSSRWKVRHHVPNVHCYWVVLRKGACEPRSHRR